MIKQMAGGQTGNGISVTGAVTTFAGFLADIPWVTIVGMLVAVFGFLINAYFGWRKDKREQEKAELEKQVLLSQIEHLRGGGNAKK